MKTYFQSLYKILVSIFNYFFHEETNDHKRTVYDRLISASVCDSIDFLYYKQYHNENKSRKDLTEPPVSQQKELYQAPSIPDIKKQFRAWSENMKEYDAIRKQLVEKSLTQLLNTNSLFVEDINYMIEEVSSFVPPFEQKFFIC
jgi:hypothetical protein